MDGFAHSLVGAVLSQADNPLPTEEDGCASTKMSRSYRSGADGVVAHNVSFRNAFPQRGL
jgi:hypothetical protein